MIGGRASINDPAGLSSVYVVTPKGQVCDGNDGLPPVTFKAGAQAVYIPDKKKIIVAGGKTVGKS